MKTQKLIFKCSIFLIIIYFGCSGSNVNSPSSTPSAPSEQFESRIRKADFTGAMENAASCIVAKNNNMTGAVFPFTERGIGNSLFGEYVAEKLMIALMETGKFELVERSHLETVIKEQQLGQKGELDDKSAASIGNMAGAKAVLIGTLTNLGARWELSVRMLDTTKAKILAFCAVSFSSNGLPLTLFSQKIATDSSLAKIPDTTTESVGKDVNTSDHPRSIIVNNEKQPPWSVRFSWNSPLVDFRFGFLTQSQAQEIAIVTRKTIDRAGFCHSCRISILRLVNNRLNRIWGEEPVSVGHYSAVTLPIELTIGKINRKEMLIVENSNNSAARLFSWNGNYFVEKPSIRTNTGRIVQQLDENGIPVLVVSDGGAIGCYYQKENKWIGQYFQCPLFSSIPEPLDTSENDPYSWDKIQVGNFLSTKKERQILAYKQNGQVGIFTTKGKRIWEDRVTSNSIRGIDLWDADGDHRPDLWISTKVEGKLASSCSVALYKWNVGFSKSNEWRIGSCDDIAGPRHNASGYLFVAVTHGERTDFHSMKWPSNSTQ